MSSAHRSLLMVSLIGLACTTYGQDIFTIAGVPYGHRKAVGGPATAARLSSPRGMVFDSQGNLDIAETSCDCIRQVTPSGIISTVYTLSGSPGTGLREVEGLSIDAQDNLYLTEWLGHTVLRIGANGSVTTLAGTG